MILMTDSHVNRAHSKGAALDESSSRRGTDDESDFSSILVTRASEGAALRYHPERSEGPLHVVVKRQTLEHDSLPLSLSVTSSPKSTHSDTAQFHL